MPKTVSSALLADIQANVTRLATCVEIKRRDGHVLRLTNHDADLVIDGQTFRHDMPFTLSAIGKDSNLSVDNTEMTFFADDTVWDFTGLKNGLYEYSDVLIRLVDYKNLSHGSMTLCKGWFGNLKWNENRVVTATITGMLKILDFEVGRIYQPSCDADLGDERCMVAIDHSQIYSPENKYHVGEWVYHYNPSLYTDFTVVNPSFEADGFLGTSATITGWTRTSGTSYLGVQDDSGFAGTFGPLDGSFMLVGTQDFGAAAVGTENGVYQDIDLSSAGTTDIDAGKIFIGYIVGLVQGVYFVDPVRLLIEIRDTNGVLIDSRDTGYLRGKADKQEPERWWEQGLVFPLRPGARSARIYIMFRKDDGEVWNQGADKVRLFWWDHTLGNPYEDVVHQMVRVNGFGEDTQANVTNASFEEDGNVANADNPTITGWTTGAGNWWQVTNFAGGGGLANIHGLHYLKGGDDGGAAQQTYAISQTKLLATDFGLDAARILLGKYIGTFSVVVGWTDVDSAATVTVELLDDANSVVNSIVVANAMTNAGAPTTQTLSANFAVTTTATKARVRLEATSPTGDGAAGIVYDDVQFHFADAERPKAGDSIYGDGNDVTFSVTPGVYTLDNDLIWKAISAFVAFDVVAAVPSDKVIRGTNIAGATGLYETTAITWLSGANAGMKNLVRVWTPGTKDLKMYFKPVFPVQAGDRFMYKRTCARRFTEDCVLTFGNAVNFRGFPHLPGKLT